MSKSSTKTRIYLIRHGEVEGHEHPRYNGQSDVPLTPKGIAQYKALLERLKSEHITACYTSDLSRCAQGAQIFAEHFQIIATVKKELREIHIGCWEGMLWQDIMKQFPDQWENRHKDLPNYRIPHGENLFDASSRVISAIETIVSAHKGENVLVVGHGGINRLILLHALKAPLGSLENIEQNYCCLNVLDYYTDGRSIIKAINS